MRRALAQAVVIVSVAAAAHGDGLEFQYTPGPMFPAPGSYLNVSVYANVPVNGTPIAWTTVGGTGQIGAMEGFSSAIYDVHASAGLWSGNTAGPGLIWQGVGFNQGSTVNNISSGVGFGLPIPGPHVLLWSARLTLPAQPIPTGVLTLDTAFRPIGSPPNGPYQGIEVFLSGIIPNLNVVHYLTGLPNAHVVIPVPAPGAAAVLVMGGLVAARPASAPGGEENPMIAGTAVFCIMIATPALADGLEFEYTPGPMFPAPGSTLNVSVYANVSWGHITFGPGLVFWPGKTTGTPSGSSYLGINTGVGFGPPLPGPWLELWNGRLTLPPTPVPGGVLTLSTTFRPLGTPPNGPYQGIEVQLSGIHPTLNVSHFLTGLPNAHVVIPVPAPGAAAVLAAAGVLLAPRRQRRSSFRAVPARRS